MSKVPKKKKKKEVVGATIFARKQYDSPEVGAIVEKINFFSICARISRYVAWPIMGVSLLLFLFTACGILYLAEFSFSKPLLFGAMFSIGTMNIFSGLLLLARD